MNRDRTSPVPVGMLAVARIDAGREAEALTQFLATLGHNLLPEVLPVRFG